jgi:phosphoribosylamine--glycine ligase
MLESRALGEAGASVVVEKMLRGREVSFFVLSDGERFVELAACQDYKRAEDGDRGPNTGGMGSYCPSVHLDERSREAIVARVVRPTLEGLAAEGRPYRGVLYAGLMLTDEGPQVLEFNARFGDPETQALLPRLDGDWLPLLHAAATGRLEPGPLRWKDGATVCVVIASAGYPGTARDGVPIHGLDSASEVPGALVFHAGTDADGAGGFVTRGGRVLGVTGVGAGIPEARAAAYAAVSRIRFDGMQFRTDIALDAAGRVAAGRT